MPLRRTDAIRRHRRFLTIATTMALAIVVLVVFAAPAVELAFESEGVRAPAATRALAETGRFIADRPIRFFLLGLVLYGLAHTGYSVLDRPRAR